MLTKETFQNLATSFLKVDFAAFKKSLVIRTANEVDYGQEQTYTIESGFGIPLSIDKKLLDSQLVQITDTAIFTAKSEWSSNLRADNVDLIFGGQVMHIVHIDEDAADAAYIIYARAK